MKNNQNVEEKENKENIKNTDIGSEEKVQSTEDNDSDSAGETIPDPYIDKSVEIRNGLYGKWIYNKREKTYSFDYMGAAVRIKKIIVYAETQDRVLELYFYDARGEKVEFSIPRQKMTELNISEFTRNENNSVLMSSHIISDLEKTCDYIAFIHGGNLILCEEKDMLSEKFCTVKGSDEFINSLDAQAVIGKKSTPYGTQAVVYRDMIPKNINVSAVSVEDLFLLMAKEDK